MDNIIVRIIDLPLLVEGVTIPSDDGFYNIYVNAKYTYEIQKEILKHELTHIGYGDFDNLDSILTCENRANELSKGNEPISAI